MAHTHEVHGDTSATGLAAGMTLAIGVLLLAVLIAALVLLIAQPWDDGDGGTRNIPVIEEPVDGGGGGGDGEAPEGQ